MEANTPRFVVIFLLMFIYGKRQITGCRKVRVARRERFFKKICYGAKSVLQELILFPTYNDNNDDVDSKSLEITPIKFMLDYHESCSSWDSLHSPESYFF